MLPLVVVAEGIAVAVKAGALAAAVGHGGEGDGLAAREEGRYLGLGFSTFIAAAPGPPDYGEITGLGAPRDPAVARLEPDEFRRVVTEDAVTRAGITANP